MYWQDAKDQLEPIITTQKFGLLLDVDGTISPIVTDPSAAQITDRARSILTNLQDCLPLLAFVSGRAAADIHKRVGIEGGLYIGNHGMEQWVNGSVERNPAVVKYRPNIEAAVGEAEPLFPDGMWAEDKITTISLHYRQARDPKRVSEDMKHVLGDIAAKHHLDLFEGNMIFELRPPVKINKGSALTRLIDEYDLEAVFFVGDDVTDSEAFEVARELREAGTCQAYALGVESDYMPAVVAETADYLALGVGGVEDFLSFSLSARVASSNCA